MKNVLLSLVVAFAAWFWLFSPWTAGITPFWYTLTISSLLLTALSVCFGRDWIKQLHFNAREIALGVTMALAFWVVFWMGDKISSFLFSFARAQVDGIYSLRGGDSAFLIGTLLLLIVGPGEELFWRAFVQRRMMDRWGKNTGFVVATLCYTMEHIWSLNFMLIMAALVIGALWGLFYRLFPQHLTALIISHALWDTLVFVVWPI